MKQGTNIGTVKKPSKKSSEPVIDGLFSGCSVRPTGRMFGAQKRELLYRGRVFFYIPTLG